jgi:hypothetical protein
MGGLARYQAMHAFLRKLHALNDAGENGDSLCPEFVPVGSPVGLVPSWLHPP